MAHETMYYINLLDKLISDYVDDVGYDKILNKLIHYRLSDQDIQELGFDLEDIKEKRTGQCENNKKYNVTLTEILQKTFYVEANNEEEAHDIVYHRYINAEDDYVLTADDFAGYKIKANKEII